MSLIYLDININEDNDNIKKKIFYIHHFKISTLIF